MTQRTFEDPQFELTFSYPDPTPGGQGVTLDGGPYRGGLRAHLRTVDRELYIEVVRFPLMAPDDEYAAHRAGLEKQFGAGSVSELRAAEFARRQARAYTFAWPEGRREAIFFSTPGWSYRVIYNPASPLNASVLEGARIVEFG
ncbi:MAG TPA: hypothetical protein VIH21_07035 [Dehalococcoidia bacterium]